MSNKVKIYMIIALSASLLLSACAVPTSAADSEKLRLCVTIYPLSYFADRIGGERVEIHQLIPAGAEPHDWEPTPGNIIMLENSDIFIYNGAGLEHWVSSVLPSVKSKTLTAVETAAGLDLLKMEGDCGDCGYRHQHGAADPHIWLSPRSATEQARAIKEALISVDIEGKSYYESNFRDISNQLYELDKLYSETLEPLQGKEIVVAHAAFGYLCRDYGLSQVAVQGFFPGADPGPADMARIIEYVRRSGIKIIFFESAESDKVARAIAAETGAEVRVLHPLETLSESQIAAGEDYFTIMRKNLGALEKALG